MAFISFPVPTNDFVSYAGALTGTLAWGCSLAPISIKIDQSLTGNSSGQTDINLIRNENTTGFTAPTNSLVNLLGLYFNCGGVGSTGGFNTFNCVLNLNRTSANNNGSYVSGTFVAQGTVNDGGTPSSPKSAIFGINPNVRLVNTATNWLQLIGCEIDIAVGTGASVADKIGEQIVQTTIDTVNGSRSNIGHLLANQAAAGSGTIGWDIGYCFGAYSGFNAIKSTGTLIGTFSHAGVVGGSMGTVTYGVDISGYTFTGAPFVAALQTPASSSAVGKTGSICWDGSFIYVCVATNTWARATLNAF